MTVTDYGLRFL